MTHVSKLAISLISAATVAGGGTFAVLSVIPKTEKSVEENVIIESIMEEPVVEETQEQEAEPTPVPEVIEPVQETQIEEIEEEPIMYYGGKVYYGTQEEKAWQKLVDVMLNNDYLAEHYRLMKAAGLADNAETYFSSYENWQLYDHNEERTLMWWGLSHQQYEQFLVSAL